MPEEIQYPVYQVSCIQGTNSFSVMFGITNNDALTEQEVTDLAEAIKVAVQDAAGSTPVTASLRAIGVNTF